MKYLLLAAGLLGLASCHQQDDPTPAPTPTPSATLIGRWRLQDSKLLMTPTSGQPYNVPVYMPSDSTFITFTTDGHYVLEFGITKSQFTYTATATDYTVTTYDANQQVYIVKRTIQRLTAKELVASYTKDEVRNGAVIGTSTGTDTYVRRN